mmetsp:Transcript_12318/g.43648  ORF Transcript_12318/g.43648 Transcript_12318/m.43648 type:complete len:249 (-) Transcript_12318:439-1185(-)
MKVQFFAMSRVIKRRPPLPATPDAARPTSAGLLAESASSASAFSAQWRARRAWPATFAGGGLVRSSSFSASSFLAAAASEGGFGGLSLSMSATCFISPFLSETPMRLAWAADNVTPPTLIACAVETADRLGRGTGFGGGWRGGAAAETVGWPGAGLRDVGWPGAGLRSAGWPGAGLRGASSSTSSSKPSASSYSSPAGGTPRQLPPLPPSESASKETRILRAATSAAALGSEVRGAGGAPLGVASKTP